MKVKHLTHPYKSTRTYCGKLIAFKIGSTKDILLVTCKKCINIKGLIDDFSQGITL